MDVQEKTNSRIMTFDVARGLAIIFMIMQHIVLTYGTTGAQNSIVGNIIIIMGTAPAAPVFMFLMGTLFLNVSTKTFQVSIKRGFKLILFGYILNIFRFGLPIILALLDAIEKGNTVTFDIDPIRYFTFVDIFHFAGIALIPCSLLVRYLRKPIIWILIIVIIAYVSPQLWGIKSNIIILDFILDLFFGNGQHIMFPVFPWLAYPLAGMVYGQVIEKTSTFETDLFFNKSILVGLTLGITGLIISLQDISFHFGDYHRVGFGGLLSIIGFVILWLGILHKLGGLFQNNIIKNGLEYLSKNLTKIYVIQWIIIGWGMLIFDSNKNSIEMNLLQIVIVIPLSLIVLKLYSLTPWRKY